MIIHIGENISLLEEDIVVILDKKAVSSSKHTKKFIDKLIENGSLITPLDESIKTYIIVSEKRRKKDRKIEKKYKLYTSNISSISLLKRKGFNGQI